MSAKSGRCTPLNIIEEAQQVNDQLLPVKSKDIYMKTYNDYKLWCLSKNISNTSENVLLVFFKQQAQIKKASTLWAIFSMLKSTLALKEGLDISRYYKVLAFLKRQNNLYKPKKSATFSKQEVSKFLSEAPDELYLPTKAVLVFGLAGACRTDELVKMTMSDIDIRDDLIVVNIPNSKNATSRKFVLMDPLWFEIAKKYLKNRPIPDIPRVFIRFRGNKPTKQNIGHNTISKMPYKIAKYLMLKDAEVYTGHTFRRTSATFLAESGGDILTLKRHGGWKSSTVAEGYIEESIADKKRIAEMVQGTSTQGGNLQMVKPTEVNHFDDPVPSTSCGTNSTPSLTLQEICNQDIKINATSTSNTSNSTTSMNMGLSTINMTCHNCTINYYR